MTGIFQATTAAVFAFFFFTSEAPAPLIPYSYTEFSIDVGGAFDRIAREHGLDGKEASDSKKVAGAWYYVWPCKGDAGKIPEELARSDIRQLTYPKSPFISAVQDMVMVLVIQDPRAENEHACRFALDIANMY